MFGFQEKGRQLNLEPESTQLIRNLFHEYEFIDCAQELENDKKIDVIIPVLHSNDLWRENLISFYREIPINRLIIGDAGCIDDTISIVEKFPRVQIIDHTEISTLGASIADLISRVTTTKFAYLQSDVYLPKGWFMAMESKSQTFPWVGSPMQVVTMLDYSVDYSGKRPLAGAQLGQTSIFNGLGSFIADDYVYRQEDFVLEEFVRRSGFATGNSFETFHFHQVMRRKTRGMEMNVENISVKLVESKKETDRVSDTQLSGFLKYCDPHLPEVRSAAYAAYQEQKGGSFNRFKQALNFARDNNKAWISMIVRFALKLLVVRTLLFSSRVILRLTDVILRIR